MSVWNDLTNAADGGFPYWALAHREHFADLASSAADAREENITAVLAGLAGHFLDKARRPAPPFMPSLREFQRAEGLTALTWACDRVERAPRTK